MKLLTFGPLTSSEPSGDHASERAIILLSLVYFISSIEPILFY
jgi:hypothetical protein